MSAGDQGSHESGGGYERSCDRRGHADPLEPPVCCALTRLLFRRALSQPCARLDRRVAEIRGPVEFPPNALLADLLELGALALVRPHLLRHGAAPVVARNTAATGPGSRADEGSPA